MTNDRATAPENAAKLEAGTAIGPAWTASVFIALGIPLNIWLAHEKLFASFTPPGMAWWFGAAAVAVCFALAVFVMWRLYPFIRHPIRAIIDPRGLSLIGQGEIIPWECVESLHIKRSTLYVRLHEPLLRRNRRAARYWVPACLPREKVRFMDMLTRYHGEGSGPCLKKK